MKQAMQLLYIKEKSQINNIICQNNNQQYQ